MTYRLLIVDDEPDVIELFRQSFRREIRAGVYDLRFAASGADALRLLAGSAGGESILLLCDINMPGMSGLELLSDVRGRWPQLPVIMITAYGDPAIRTAALAQGAADFVTKPIDFAELKRRLASVAAGAAP
ncbi:MAG: response regulator [Defluviicoccus sp.]